MGQIPSGYHRSASAWIHDQTAGLFNDMERPRSLNEPHTRVIGRLVFALFSILLFISIATVLVTQKEAFRTIRHWDSGYALKVFSPYIYSTTAQIDPLYLSLTSSVSCQCSRTLIPWTVFTNFYTISLYPQNTIQTAEIVNGSHFCFQQVINLPLNSSVISSLGCTNMINSIVDNGSDLVILDSSRLMDPVLLNDTIRRHSRSNLEAQLNACVSYWMAEGFAGVESAFQWLQEVADVWIAMLRQLGSEPHSSDMDVWAASNHSLTHRGGPVMGVIDNRTTVGYHVSWEDYLKQCRPLYCDVIEESSLSYRLFSLLAQMGGFGAMLLLLLKKVVWPVVRWIAGWPPSISVSSSSSLDSSRDTINIPLTTRSFSCKV